MWLLISTLTIVVSAGACAAAVLMQPAVPKMDLTPSDIHKK